MMIFKIYRKLAFILPAFAVCFSLTLSAAPQSVFTAQSLKWTASNREAFYTQDQSSRIMPLTWINALKQTNGKPFMENSLSRYGFPANKNSKPKGLPVGFTVNGDAIGMACAACHTRHIEVKGTAYRIDGGPAMVDFQSFAADLDTAVDKILKDRQAFSEFALTVLGSSATSEKQARLHQAVEDWFLSYHAIMNNALSKNPWEPARLDAVSMIFSRLTGLDIGTLKDHIIQSDIRRAEASAPYPFVWNAPTRNKTPWPGFVDNGNDLASLSRSLGEVIDIFANFYPQKEDWRITGVNFLKTNSANFKGLQDIEALIQKLKAPKWPWAFNAALAQQGKNIFESKSKTEGSGCATCHGIRDDAFRSLRKTYRYVMLKPTKNNLTY